MDTRKVQFGQFPLFAFQFPVILLTVCLFWSIGTSTVRSQTTIQFLDITSTGATSVKIEYRVTGAAFPTNSWPGKEPYWVLLRSTVDGGTSGEEDQRELIPASKRTVGDHEIDIELRQAYGHYAFVLCTEPPGTLGYFGVTFTNNAGTVTHPNLSITPVTEDEPTAVAPEFPPKCVSCEGGGS